MLSAFFNAEDLREWWQVVRSVTVPRPLGTFAVEWNSTEFHDEVLGRLGGTFHGTVIDYRPAPSFYRRRLLATAGGRTDGPMALECAAGRKVVPTSRRLSVRQSAEEDGPRWQRYFRSSRRDGSERSAS